MDLGTHYPISTIFTKLRVGKLFDYQLNYLEDEKCFINDSENYIWDFIWAPETCFQRAEMITLSVVVVVVLQHWQCSTHYHVLQLHRKHSSAHQNFNEDLIRNFISDSLITNPTVKLQTYLELLYSYSDWW